MIVSALGGGLAYRTAKGALEGELDRKIWQVAAAAAEMGLDAGVLISLQPGLGIEVEERGPFMSVQARLRRLRRVVDEAYWQTRSGRPRPTSSSTRSRDAGRKWGS